jgi:amidase
MAPKTLPVAAPVPVLPRGTKEFEALRAGFLEEFAAKVPEELRLPSTIIQNPPRNVTGVPRECGILTPEEIDITENYDATYP